MTPIEVLEKRAEYFNDMLPELIFGLYSKTSQFRQFFADMESYTKHFRSAVDHNPVALEVFRESIDGESAEVLFLERQMIEERERLCYGKAVFIKEDDDWKIVNEIRESKSSEFEDI